jgi:hypothetical protein
MVWGFPSIQLSIPGFAEKHLCNPAMLPDPLPDDLEALSALALIQVL